MGNFCLHLHLLRCKLIFTPGCKVSPFCNRSCNSETQIHFHARTLLLLNVETLWTLQLENCFECLLFLYLLRRDRSTYICVGGWMFLVCINITSYSNFWMEISSFWKSSGRKAPFSLRWLVVMVNSGVWRWTLSSSTTMEMSWEMFFTLGKSPGG